MADLILEDIARDFFDGREIRRVLYPLSLTLSPGELTVLAGPSGSGKTPSCLSSAWCCGPPKAELSWMAR